MAEEGPGTDLDPGSPDQEDQSTLAAVVVRTEGILDLGQSLLAVGGRQILAQTEGDSEVGSHTAVDNLGVGRVIRGGLVMGPVVAQVLADPAGTSSESHIVSASSTRPECNEGGSWYAQSEGRQRKYPHGFAHSAQVCD